VIELGGRTVKNYRDLSDDVAYISHVDVPQSRKGRVAFLIEGVSKRRRPRVRRAKLPYQTADLLLLINRIPRGEPLQ